jgi:BolA protein
MTETQSIENTNAQRIASPIAIAIENKLKAQFAPSYLQVINESGNHNVPKGSESHFKLVIVSSHFEGHRTLHRHRMVYGVLEQELAGPVHALALHIYTDAEWGEIEAAPDSPNCHGGSKADAQTAEQR